MENQNPQPPTEQSQPIASQPPSSGPSKTFLILIVLIIIVAVGAGAYFLGMKNIPPTSQPVVTVSVVIKPTPTVDPTTNWIPYNDDQYQFSFEHPADWVKEGICNYNKTNPLCLTIIDYNSISQIKQNEPVIDPLYDKSFFNKTKNSLDQGLVPSSYKDWKLITIGNKHGIQSPIYYNVENGMYLVDTDVLTNKAAIILTVKIPVDPVYKGQLIDVGKVVDIEKSQAKEKDLNNGIMNDQAKMVLSDYNQLLSTFTFTNQNQITVSPTSVNPEGKACGGIAGEVGQFACPTGYVCQYPKPMYPDAQGTCVRQ